MPVCRRIFFRSCQQLLNFIPTQRGGEFFFAADGGLDDLALAVLQREDLFLDGVASDELIAGHDFSLADAVRASRRLVFDGWIPPWVEMDDGIGCGQVE